MSSEDTLTKKEHNGDLHGWWILMTLFFGAFALLFVAIALSAGTGINAGWHDRVNDRLGTLEAPRYPVTPTPTCVAYYHGPPEVCLVPRETPTP